MGFLKKREVVRKINTFICSVRKNNNRIGKIPRAITLNYNNLCNFKCDFCFSSDANNEFIKTKLPMDVIADLADQAHSLGIWEIVLTGGELTLNKEELISLIKCLGPDRFHMVLITNGWLIDQQYANDLAEAGLDCLAVSLSTMDAKTHDESRHVPGAHARALQALANGKKAGMAVWPNLIFGHHNAFSKDLIDTLEYAKEHGYTTYFMLAMPFGSFKNDRLDSKDMQRFTDLRKQYDCFFDTWDLYDKKKEGISGCWTVNRTYIAPTGDVFPCPYIPIALGNIKEQSLKEILEYGFSIKHFGHFSPICVSACNRSFRERFLSRDDVTVFKPLNAKEIFEQVDFDSVEELPLYRN